MKTIVIQVEKSEVKGPFKGESKNNKEYDYYKLNLTANNITYSKLQFSSVNPYAQGDTVKLNYQENQGKRGVYYNIVEDSLTIDTPSAPPILNSNNFQGRAD